MGNATCPNCQTTLGCSCKLRVASDGTRCCASCLAAYEEKLKQEKLKQQTQ